MKNISNKLYSIQDFITKIAGILGGISLALIVISYVYEVVTRYIFSSPTAWVSDFVSYALCASIFLALPMVTKDKGHVAVTILMDLMPAKIADIVYRLINVVGFLYLGFSAWISLHENIRQFSKGIDTLARIPVPQWWISSFITFGLGMSALYMLRHALTYNRIDGADLMEQSN